MQAQYINCSYEQETHAFGVNKTASTDPAPVVAAPTPPAAVNMTNTSGDGGLAQDNTAQAARQKAATQGSVLTGGGDMSPSDPTKKSILGG